MRTFPTAQDIQQFIERASSGQFTAQDLDAFYKNPKFWQPESALITPEDAQTFWQMVWDELALEIGCRLIVPPVPRLTDRQCKSIIQHRLLPVYIPALSEERYPSCFLKPDWGKLIDASQIERKPLEGIWIAIEAIKKPDHDVSESYPDDSLMAAIKCSGRYSRSYEDLSKWMFDKVAKTTGFPRKRVRLPSLEEWNLVGNLFNWLRERRSMDLPDLGTTRSREWCENTYKSEQRLFSGHSLRGGFAEVDALGHGFRDRSIAFRVLFEL